MGRPVIFVSKAPVATIDGGNVYVEVRSGRDGEEEIFLFECPISVFMQTFAHFGEVARDWRVEQSGKVERIDHWRDQPNLLIQQLGSS